jgi:quinol monooxygenase YgiN
MQCFSSSCSCSGDAATSDYLEDGRQRGFLQMQDQVSWWVELTLGAGQLADFERITGEMVEAARHETGVLSYQRFISDDRTTVHVYERYADSGSAGAHLRRFDETFADRFAGMVRRRRFTVFGRPSEELKRLLDRYGAVYLEPFARFDYWA